MTDKTYQLEVRPVLPEAIRELETLANDLYYSWDRHVRGLFHSLDRELWRECGHSPKVFLRRIKQARLDAAAENNLFLQEYSRIVSAYHSYLKQSPHPRVEEHFDPETDLVAYFCAEYGLHESFPIYSGGLGILAGDHCKAASDLGLPFVAVGLLYRQGYFNQTIDGNGQQHAHYTPTDFDALPLSPARDERGEELRVHVDLPGRRVLLRVWEAKAGHIRLYLLDSDLPENSEADRAITFQLYGGDKTTRIQQEIVLGIGGMRALRALGLSPTVYHINEGHAAFQIVERCREFVEQGHDFATALELVAAGTVFTTHTPVPAGHDIFHLDLMTEYFSDFVAGLGVSFEEFLQLGATPENHGGFNMTTLALRGSRFHNGVSRIHGGVASRMEGYVWPQIPPEDNPISYVTNGVHVPTFLAREWINLFDMRFPEWRNHMLEPEFWQRLDEIPDHRFWSLRQELKTQMLEDVTRRTRERLHREGASEATIRRATRFISQTESDLLVMGFARRFATYKRATLIFSDPERLKRLLGDPDRPVVIIFAGKAHPSDHPGQELIRTIHHYSMQPEFIGKIILLEGYDMALARKLVTGVDVWLNTPEYPMEASGTSGEKAAINGVLNLSVLDGWWGEGYNGKNGWAIAPHSPDFDPAFRDAQEATDMLDIIEHEVIPTFYNRDQHGYSRKWVEMSREAMKSCIPQFNSMRMVNDYVQQFYSAARNHCVRLQSRNREEAKELAHWKRKVREHWEKVSAERLDEARPWLQYGHALPIRVRAFLNGLSPDDVAVECVIGHTDEQGTFHQEAVYPLQHQEQDGKSHIFVLDLQPDECGLKTYRLRLYPHHRLLSHPFEMGYLIWI
ncbi:MAG TPA: glycosyltransferase family 1 protein [Gammaproteobacteria bacterium]|nr:glycosyltransferase family 1 protein [Gammaproteobacteria bacterium]